MLDMNAPALTQAMPASTSKVVLRPTTMCWVAGSPSFMVIVTGTVTFSLW